MVIGWESSSSVGGVCDGWGFTCTEVFVSVAFLVVDDVGALMGGCAAERVGL